MLVARSALDAGSGALGGPRGALPLGVKQIYNHADLPPTIYSTSVRLLFAAILSASLTTRPGIRFPKSCYTSAPDTLLPN